MLRTALFIICVLFSTFTAAAGFTSYPTGVDTDGQYNLQWTNLAGQVISVRVKEYESGVFTRNVAFSGTSTTVRSGNGTYRYDLWNTLRYYNNGEWFVEEKKVDSVTVKVSIPPSTPGTPGRVQLPTSDTDGSFTISWGTSTGQVTRYELDQSHNAGGFKRIYTGPNTSTSLSGLSDGKYTFRVRACYVAGGSTYCSLYNSDRTTVAHPPGPPSSISNAATNNQGAFAVSWGTSSGTVVRYELEQKKSGGEWENIYSGTSRSKALSGLGDGTYTYRVRACNEVEGFSACGGYRTSGNTLVALTPGTPGSISAPSTSDRGAFNVSWAAASGNVKSYQLQQQFNGGSWSQVYSGSGRTKSVIGLNDGRYVYRVRACNTQGSYTTCSGYRSSSIILVSQKPGVPTLTLKELAVVGDLEVSWTAPSTAVDYYALYQQVDGDGWSQVYRGSAQKRALHVSNGTYAYRVQACNTTDSFTVCGNFSNAPSVRVTQAPPHYDGMEAPPLPAAAPVVPQSEVDASDRVGTTAGQLQVNELGSAVYSIPIITGPASGDVKPTISLDYDSQGGNGLLGKGWAISGLSRITRCRKTPEQDDDVSIFGSRYCLDGQRLVAYEGNDGANGTYYRTEIDTFMRVESVSSGSLSPDYFIVRRKDGSVSYYGNGENTFLTKYTDHKTLWLLHTFSDSVGNTITYHYDHDPDSGELVINRIDYASNGDVPATNSIQFHYTENRPDKTTRYQFGIRQLLEKRLSRIQSLSDNTELRTYRLGYTESTTGNSLLQDVQECVTSVCRKKLSFDWSQPSVGVGPENINYTDFSARYSDGKWGDINGDGKSDLVWMYFHNGSGVNKYYWRISLSNGSTLALQPSELRARTGSRREWHLLDFNDDGKMDLLHAPSDGSNSFWQVNLSQGDRFGPTTVTSVPFEFGTLELQDMNADGIPDLTKFDHAPATVDARLQVRYLKRSATGGLEIDGEWSSVELSLGNSVDNIDWWAYSFHYKYMTTADFDNNGEADFVLGIFAECTEEPFICENKPDLFRYVVLKNGSVKQHFSATATTYNTGWEFLPADFNQDGLTDLLYRDGTKNSWHYLINTETGFETSAALTHIVTHKFSWTQGTIFAIKGQNFSPQPEIANECPKTYPCQRSCL